MTVKEFIRRFRNAFLYKVVSRFPYNKVRIWGLRKLGHVIGKDVYIPSNTIIAQNFVYNRGKLLIGDRVAVGPSAMFILASHPNRSKIRDVMVPQSEGVITIGNDAWIGGGAIVMPGIEIGEGAVVGAGSVVTKNVEPYTVVVGNPAKILRKVTIE